MIQGQVCIYVCMFMFEFMNVTYKYVRMYILCMYVYFVYENCTYMSVRYNVNKRRKNAQYAVGRRRAHPPPMVTTHLTFLRRMKSNTIAFLRLSPSDVSFNLPNRSASCTSTPVGSENQYRWLCICTVCMKTRLEEDELRLEHIQ